MTALIVEARPATDETWDAIFEACSYATAFHSRAWAEVWRDATAGRVSPDPLLARFDDGAEALLPLSRERRMKGMRSCCLSSPGGTYGGWLSRDELTPEHAAALVRLMRSRTGSLEWRANPFDPLAVQVASERGDADVTHVIDLDCDGDELRRRLSRKRIPRKVRAAEGHGLVVDRLDAAALTAYYELYLDCRERWESASTTYSIDFFERLFRAPLCELWGVRSPDGRIVCAGPMLVAPRHVVSWLGLARSDALHMKPYEFLYHTLILEYHARGFTHLDMNPSGGHEGVAEFKRRLGAVEMPCPVERRRTLAERVAQRVRRAVKA